MPQAAARPLAARPLRRDAADNRERLLAAAELVFARDGVDAGIEQVAREAGLGMGTVYRRFATKQALIDELIDVLLEEMIDAGRAAIGQADGLERYLRAAGALLFERRGFLPMVWRGQQRSPKVEQLRAIYAELLAHAQETGRAAREVTSTDISIVLWSLRGVMEMTFAVAPDAWMRHLDFLLAGMRVEAIDHHAPPLRIEQVDQIVSRAD
jgi:AcrR family transcriptional regulator